MRCSRLREDEMFTLHLISPVPCAVPRHRGGLSPNPTTRGRRSRWPASRPCGDAATQEMDVSEVSSPVEEASDQEILPSSRIAYANESSLSCILARSRLLSGGGLWTDTTDIWGVFCPVVGILFATLISSTVDRLWSRQEDRVPVLVAGEARH